ncbi:MAG: UDP-N-acetylmuramate dehydrogenase [Flammeovirgaceae bacterium]|jgi:UDP-N-acetylmuramate dehydrogenase
MNFQSNYSLKNLNTFGIDAKAKSFTEVNSEDELKAVLQNEKAKQNRILPLGGGSNMLFTQDFEGLVIQNSIQGLEIIEQSEKEAIIEVGGGENWHEFVLKTLENNWGGLENLSLIPGTVGASPIQNIGAYGVELKDTFVSLRAMEITTGEIREFTHQECNFGYRESIFKTDLKGKYIITKVTFRLTHSNHNTNISYGAISQVLKEWEVEAPTVQDISRAVISIRESKLPNPTEIGNCGSFFKNPEIPEAEFEKVKANFPNIVSYPASKSGFIKVPAGWLIEQCGWKGKKVGNVGTFPKQALVIINLGNATGEEAKNFAMEIRKSVWNKFGIEINPEVNLIE